MGLDAVIETLDCPSCVPGLETTLAYRWVRWRGSTPLLATRSSLTRPRLRLTIFGILGNAGHRIAAFDPDRLHHRLEGKPACRWRRWWQASRSPTSLSVAVWAGLVQDMGEEPRAVPLGLGADCAFRRLPMRAVRFHLGDRALRSGLMNMDSPIALAVILAAGMSLFETTSGTASTVRPANAALGLPVFFLLIGRFLDRNLRGKAFAAAENLLHFAT